MWLKITNDSEQNRHQFYYSIDGQNYIPAGSPFAMRGGYWKGIRVGLFCYEPTSQAKSKRKTATSIAQFDCFEQKYAQ